MERKLLKLRQADGYRGIWYCCDRLEGERRYKYSGGLGTYCAKHIPLAWHAPEAHKTFFCYGGWPKDRNRLLHMISYYDHATGTVPGPRVLMDKATSDAHDNPTILIDAAGHVWVFSSAHGTARPAYIYRSVRPHDIDEFERTLETNFSYPQAWPVPGRGILFLHTRYVKGRRLLHWMTSPDGRSWSRPARLAEMRRGHYQISWPCGRKVGTAFNYHPDAGEFAGDASRRARDRAGVDGRTNLYYLETRDFGATWRTAGGQAVATPLRTIDSPALVHDFRAEGRLVYLKDLKFDARGRPIILVVTSGSWHPGPEGGPRRWTTARWTGRRWEVRSALESDNNYDTGCLHVTPEGVWRIVGPTEVGPQPFSTGGEMALWASPDRGATWKKLRRMTSGSEFNHTYARPPVNAHRDFYAFWADGHGRRPSRSRLYFCNAEGEVFRLPERMAAPRASPQRLATRQGEQDG